MAEFKERTEEEWAIASQKELDKTNDYCNGSLDNWRVVRSGRQYQLMQGGIVIQSNKSIWKLKQWVFENVRYPYAYGQSTEERTYPDTGKIATHYQGQTAQIQKIKDWLLSTNPQSLDNAFSQNGDLDDPFSLALIRSVFSSLQGADN